MKIIVSICLLFLIIIASSQTLNGQYKYWIGFTNKQNNSFSLNNPQNFLSQKSIQRRINQNIQYNNTDLPVSKTYIDSIKNYPLKVIYALKWLNGIVVETSESNLDLSQSKYPFVKEIRLIYTSKTKKSTINKFNIQPFTDINFITSNNYGPSEKQITIINGDFLHDKGYYGNNMLIAVLDGGFGRVNILSAFDSLWQNNQIVGTKDLVDPSADVFTENYHGMHVLSLMGGNTPGKLMGTAPKANYFLIRTEDVRTEYPIEEYNWIAGAEFADSIGADIINSSLGYYSFDDSLSDYTYADMDGNSTIVVKGADIAASKGILVLASAGNEGNKDWHYLISPSDGDSVLCTGAIVTNGKKADFSSFGPRYDGIIKPNVMAPGSEVVIQNYDSSFTHGHGTSYSSPMIAGMAACLWQAFPKRTNMEIFNAIEMSALNYYNPSDSMGNGIANFKKAYLILEEYNKKTNDNSFSYKIFPNPFTTELNIILYNTINDKITIKISSLSGKIKYSNSYNIIENEITFIPIYDIGYLSKDIYVMTIKSNQFSKTIKLLKN